MPSVAMRERERLPMGVLEDILEVRAYAGAKQLYDSARNEKDLPASPWIDRVREIDFLLAQEALDAMKAQNG